MSETAWREWLASVSDGDIYAIAEAAVERLIEIEEVKFDNLDGPGGEEDRERQPCLYWDFNGEDLRIPFRENSAHSLLVSGP